MEPEAQEFLAFFDLSCVPCWLFFSVALVLCLLRSSPSAQSNSRLTEHSPKKGQKDKIRQCRWHVLSLGNCCPLVANPGNNSQETCSRAVSFQCFPHQQSATLGNLLEMQNLGIHSRPTESENLLKPMPNLSEQAHQMILMMLKGWKPLFSTQPQIPTLLFPLPTKCNLISNIEQQNFLFKFNPPHVLEKLPVSLGVFF